VVYLGHKPNYLNGHTPVGKTGEHSHLDSLVS
jgi:hypothetical protein